MPHFDYCCKVWNVLGVLAERLQKHHNKCARVIMRYKNEAGKSELVLHHLGWSLLSEQRILTKALRFSKTWYLRSFRIFSGTTCSNNNYHLSNTDNYLAIPLLKTEFLKKSFSFNGAKIWNSFPNEIRSSETLASFDELISTYRPTVK